LNEEGGGVVRDRRIAGVLVLLIAVLAFIAAGCGGGDGDGDGGEVSALPSATCTEIYYEGEGEPDALIASDLPLQGAGRALTIEMTEAIRLILREREFKAGDLNIGYQSCDDSTAQAGAWDSARCTQNARAYANNESVLGVIGTFNSGCAKLVIPIVNRARNGPLAMISPANTYPGLTISGPGTVSGEPDTYYPTGQRNYARVVWTDQFQGAANAQLARDLGLKNVYVLSDGETYGNGIAVLFSQYAEKLGIKTIGPTKWDKAATSYEPIATRIRASGADAVFFGGIVCNNGGKLLKDLRAGLPDLTFIGPDGWTPLSATIETGGQGAENMYITSPGIPPEDLKGRGREFVTAFERDVGRPPDPYTNYAAQAAEIMLDAIEKANGERSAVADNVLNVKVNNGILGTFEIDENGDTTLGTVSVFQIKGGESTFVKTITPEISFVKGE
jgi:branched-chain amino acid transport system substrate-binding protein